MSFKEAVFNLLVHITVLWWFLNGFFYFYVRSIEQEHIQTQIDEKLVTAVMWQAYQAKSDSGAGPGAGIRGLCSPSDVQTQADMISNNWKVMFRSVVIGVLLTVITVAWYMFFKEDIPLKLVLSENLLVFALIGMFEFIFFTKYALQYEPVSPADMANVVESKHFSI